MTGSEGGSQRRHNTDQNTEGTTQRRYTMSRVQDRRSIVANSWNTMQAATRSSAMHTRGWWEHGIQKKHRNTRGGMCGTATHGPPTQRKTISSLSAHSCATTGTRLCVWRDGNVAQDSTTQSASRSQQKQNPSQQPHTRTGSQRILPPHRGVDDPFRQKRQPPIHSRRAQNTRHPQTTSRV